MKRNISQTRSSQLSHRCRLMGLALVWSHCLYAAEEPGITITDPAPGGVHETREASINVTGDASYDAAIAEILWRTDQGAEGRTRAKTGWDGSMRWDAIGVPLVGGENEITVLVRNAAGSEASETMTVNRMLPDGEVISRSTKITTWVPDSYTQLARYTLSGKLGVAPDFALPFDQDVSVRVSVMHSESPLAEEHLFEYSVPAGTVAFRPSIYRYRRPGSQNTGTGLRELEIYPANAAGLSRLYVYVNNDDFFETQKASMSDTEFKAFLSGIETYTVTVTIGDESWAGQGGPLHSSVLDRKVEHRFSQ